MKKVKIFFIHGWGFDNSFWKPLVNEMNNKYDFYSFKFVNLGFLKTQSKIEYFDRKRKNIYVVHSYGFNWLIKNNLKFDLVINFSGKPLFIEKLNEKNFKKRILKKMISDFKINPLTVLQKFYKNCGLDSSYLNARNIIGLNKSKLLKSLEKLYFDDLTIETKENDSPIYSFFMKYDKIAPIYNPEKLFSNPKHRYELLEFDSHAFPFIHYKEAARLINLIIENYK